MLELNSEFATEFNFLCLHSTTMFESFQMDKTVDKKEKQEIIKWPIEFSRFDSAGFDVQINFTFVFW